MGPIYCKRVSDNEIFYFKPLLFRKNSSFSSRRLRTWWKASELIGVHWILILALCRQRWGRGMRSELWTEGSMHGVNSSEFCCVKVIHESGFWDENFWRSLSILMNVCTNITAPYVGRVDNETSCTSNVPGTPYTCTPFLNRIDVCTRSTRYLYRKS